MSCQRVCMVCVSHRARRAGAGTQFYPSLECRFALACRRTGAFIVSGSNLHGRGLRAQGSWRGQKAHGNAEAAAAEADELELRGILRATATGSVRRIAPG